MSDDTILVERDRSTTIITINRPHRRNAIDARTARQLATAVRAFDEDASSSVAILQGAGGTFCAGADLKALAEGDQRDLSPEADGPMGPTRIATRKPVIASVEGHAVAGGLELAIWCDLRVAAGNSTWGVFSRRFGVPLIDLGTVRLPRLIGHSRAADLIITGRSLRGEEAYEIGLVNRLTPPGAALEEAVALAQKIAAFPQIALRNDLASLRAQAGLSEHDAMRRELELGLETLRSGEAVAGARSFAAGAGRHGDLIPEAD